MAANSSIAAFVAFEAMRGSTTDARKATVLMTGLPVLLNGIGWYARGPRTPPENYTSLGHGFIYFLYENILKC